MNPLSMNMRLFTLFVAVFLFAFAGTTTIAQHGHDHSGHNHDHSGHNHNHSGHNHNHSGHNHDHSGHNHDHSGHNHAGHDHSGHGHGHSHQHNLADGHEAEGGLDIGNMILHHIADSHEWHLFGDVSIPLPIIAYSPESGLDVFLTNKFHHGHDAYKGYVLDHGVLKKVEDNAFPKEAVAVALTHDPNDEEVSYAVYNNKKYKVSRAGFYDFSITKVVATLLMTSLIMLLLFGIAGARAKGNRGVPKGIQNFVETLVAFVREDIAQPNLGHKADKYLPFLLTLFFFIWITNMLGLMAPLGSPNATGNIAITAALALITFVIITFSGNKHYWAHIFNPPGVPGFVKLILVPIEIASMFIKPAALMIRLFANITAGHIILLSFVSIIFIFTNMAGTGAGIGAAIFSGLFMLFMNVLELLVAALQAYIFTVLAAVFIGQAVEEPHHH